MITVTQVMPPDNGLPDPPLGQTSIAELRAWKQSHSQIVEVVGALPGEIDIGVWDPGSDVISAYYAIEFGPDDRDEIFALFDFQPTS